MFAGGFSPMLKDLLGEQKTWWSPFLAQISKPGYYPRYDCFCEVLIGTVWNVDAIMGRFHCCFDATLCLKKFSIRVRVKAVQNQSPTSTKHGTLCVIRYSAARVWVDRWHQSCTLNDARAASTVHPAYFFLLSSSIIFYICSRHFGTWPWRIENMFKFRTIQAS